MVDIFEVSVLGGVFLSLDFKIVSLPSKPLEVVLVGFSRMLQTLPKQRELFCGRPIMKISNIREGFLNSLFLSLIYFASKSCQF